MRFYEAEARRQLALLSDDPGDVAWACGGRSSSPASRGPALRAADRARPRRPRGAGRTRRPRGRGGRVPSRRRAGRPRPGSARPCLHAAVNGARPAWPSSAAAWPAWRRRGASANRAGATSWSIRAVLAAVLDYRETESLGNNANTARQAVSGAALFGLTLGQVRESQSAPSCKELSCSPFADSDSR